MFRCYQSQNYKIWKQFTTHFLSKLIRVWLLSIIKLQNLKAIHNNIHMDSSGSCVVINHKTTKFESNSQLDKHKLSEDIVVINHKTRKFESNSQLCRRKALALLGCYQSQNYKIWKQFTTGRIFCPLRSLLLSITKLQNLKAIHNWKPWKQNSSRVVINHKTTKFESNSQLCPCFW